MTKPPNFFDLPAILQEDLLWDMELDYDHYESSKAETIHLILFSKSHIGSRNKDIIENAYKFMNESFLAERAKSLLRSEEMEIEALRGFAFSL